MNTRNNNVPLLVSGRNGNRLSVGVGRIVYGRDGGWVGGVGVVGQQRVFEVRVRATTAAAAAESGQAQYGRPLGLVRHRRLLLLLLRGAGRWRRRQHRQSWRRLCRRVEIHNARDSVTTDSTTKLDTIPPSSLSHWLRGRTRIVLPEKRKIHRYSKAQLEGANPPPKTSCSPAKNVTNRTEIDKIIIKGVSEKKISPP